MNTAAAARLVPSRFRRQAAIHHARPQPRGLLYLFLCGVNGLAREGDDAVARLHVCIAVGQHRLNQQRREALIVLDLRCVDMQKGLYEEVEV